MSDEFKRYRLPCETPAACLCAKCVACCSRVPGWFLPEQVAPVAAFLGLGVEEFTRRYLTVATGGIQEDGDEAIPVLRPRRVEGDPEVFGTVFWDRDTLYHSSPCVFLEQGRCRIHAVKPRECRDSYGCRGTATHRLRNEIEQVWDSLTDPFLRRLTGREVVFDAMTETEREEYRRVLGEYEDTNKDPNQGPEP